MASVEIHGSEVYEGDLPRVCVLCGERATVYRKKAFQWHPPWILVLLLLGLLPFAIAAMITTKRMTVWAPFCNEHRSHWSWRAWFLWGGLGLFALVGFVTLFVVIANDRPGRIDQGQNLGWICGGTAMALLLFLFTVAIIYMTGVRPTEITDSTITLTHVSPAFIDALEDDRDLEDSRYRERERPRRRPVYDDDDDNDRPDDRDERITDRPRL